MQNHVLSSQAPRTPAVVPLVEPNTAETREEPRQETGPLQEHTLMGPATSQRTVVQGSGLWRNLLSIGSPHAFSHACTLLASTAQAGWAGMAHRSGLPSDQGLSRRPAPRDGTHRRSMATCCRQEPMLKMLAQRVSNAEAKCGEPGNDPALSATRRAHSCKKARVTQTHTHTHTHGTLLFQKIGNGRTRYIPKKIHTQIGNFFAKVFNCDAPRGEAKQRGGSCSKV